MIALGLFWCLPNINGISCLLSLFNKLCSFLFCLLDEYLPMFKYSFCYFEKITTSASTYVFSFPSFQGLTYKKLNRFDEALDCFLKLHAILRNSAQVLYQIANVYLP